MQFLISVIDDGQALAAGQAASASEAEMEAVHAFNRKLDAAGHRVFAGGLAAPDEASVVDNRGQDLVITSGTVSPSKEFVAGFWIFEAPDLDTAMELAAEGSMACNRKLEVRVIQ